MVWCWDLISALFLIFVIIVLFKVFCFSSFRKMDLVSFFMTASAVNNPSFSSVWFERIGCDWLKVNRYTCTRDSSVVYGFVFLVSRGLFHLEGTCSWGDHFFKKGWYAKRLPFCDHNSHRIILQPDWLFTKRGLCSYLPCTVALFIELMLGCAC